MEKYVIILNNVIIKSFSDPVEAIRENRINHPVWSCVYRLEDNGERTLLSKKVPLSKRKQI